MHRNIFEEDHEIFRDSVTKFLQAEVQPHLDRWLEAGIIDRELFQKAGEQGYCLMWADEAYGGMGVHDFRFEQILIEENAFHGDAGFGLSLHSRLCAPYIGQLGSEEQKQRFLPGCISGETILGIAMTEPGAGSDVAGIRTMAVEQDDHWVLNGSKIYISNGINGDVFIVAARTVPDHPHGVGLFLVERGMAGFTRGRNLKKLGLKAQDTAELFFDSVKVPKANVLGDPRKGFYYLMQFLAEERLIVACGCVAAAEAALRITIDYVKERRAFGKAIAEFQNTRFKLAEMRTRIDAAQAFVDRCVMDHNEGKLTAEVAAEAKLFTSELEGWVTDECLQLHGGAGYMDEYPISRLYANARVSRIYAGSSEIMKEIVARSMGLDPRRGSA
ncbi:acyl-CoA dehydrogenase family protein [Thioalkalivibrio sp. XN8]|uniref:acyl-CoA dehydrogenase family protein n=1 Tax=Thioalkalivibrio sp. XN8 TaxID=2712863 RepID=UPI0013E9EA4D|nr:acyl-CoA dehydrogenase family protein [Thioalkalivibrio sp. XN8]NGP53981.1 acyl-CoA dehydrogenase [Thioalkalivibrio sp. XN8]